MMNYNNRNFNHFDNMFDNFNMNRFGYGRANEGGH